MFKKWSSNVHLCAINVSNNSSYLRLLSWSSPTFICRTLSDLLKIRDFLLLAFKYLFWNDVKTVKMSFSNFKFTQYKAHICCPSRKNLSGKSPSENCPSGNCPDTSDFWYADSPEMFSQLKHFSLFYCVLSVFSLPKMLEVYKIGLFNLQENFIINFWWEWSKIKVFILCDPCPWQNSFTDVAAKNAFDQ